jgi:SAM-dependent methyltransferase
MPYSFNDLNKNVVEFVKNKYDKHTRVLDVGVGSGKYSELFKNFFNKIDGIEAWLPYIDEFKLVEKYNNLYVDDIMNKLNILTHYDLVILGDVFEHLSKENARILLNELIKNNNEAIIMVPFESIQGPYQGNSFEIHLQNDLNFDIMKIRYPEIQLIVHTVIDNYTYAFYFLNKKIVKNGNYKLQL